MSSTNRTKVYYDGQCPVCLRTRSILRRLDWFDRLEMIDFRSVPVDERPVTFEQFDEGLPVRTPDGRMLLGFAGLRHALMHVPLGAAVAWMLYIPGISHLAAMGYRWFARRRPGRSCELQPDAGGADQ